MGKLSGVADVKNVLRGTSEKDIITGGNLADRIYGLAGEDSIAGGAGNDYIDAGSGYNKINGGAGDDTIIGGNYIDYYTIDANNGNDTIIDKGSFNIMYMNFVANATSGVFIKRGNDLIIAEGTTNLTGDADGDGNDAEDLATELAGIQGLTSAAARRAGMRSIVSNLTDSVTIKNHFISGRTNYIYANGSANITNQTISVDLVDYSTGLKYFNQAVTNPDIIRGTNGVDHIVASKNSQRLIGGTSSDVYYIDAKTDVIIQDSGGDNDQLIFDDNDVGANVFTYTRQGNDLHVTFDDGSGAVVASATIKNHFNRNGSQIEYVAYDDDGVVPTGVTNDAAGDDEIGDKLPALTSATKVLRGTITDDRLDLAATGQTAYDLKGNDEYTVTAGKAVIVDHSGIADLLNADHVATENDGIYIKQGNNLIILDGGDDPDGAGGYADADAAVTAMLASNSISERRVILRSLTGMSDSVTIRNYFSTGEIETIKALNNAGITDLEVSNNLINYNTGLKYFNQGANDKVVRGTGVMDYIVATADNQKLYGGTGGDTYAIAGGFTDVEIYETANTAIETLVFTDADLDGADSYSWTKIGNDLKITITDAVDGDASVIIKNHYLSYNYKVTNLEDADGAVNIKIFSVDESGKIVGGDQTDGFYGGGGNDTLNGGGAFSNDFLIGGEGSDVYEFVTGDSGDAILETDAGADDTDKAVFLGADFSLASSSITLTKNGNNLEVSVDEGDGVISSFTVFNHYAAASNEIEVIEDGYGNSFDLTTGTPSANFNAALIGSDEDETLVASDNGIAINGNGGNDNLIGWTGNDTIKGGDGIDVVNDFGANSNDYIYGGDGNDLLDGGAGDDHIEGEAGNDTVDGDAGNDTLNGGLGDDTFISGAGNDVVLYDLDSGNAAGADTVNDFTIGEDVVRFITSANDTLGLDYRNHIAVRDTGAGLEIGYDWDEAAQDYANTITFAAYDDASVSTANVIEFVTADGTTALTAAEITAILADIAADGDAPGTLAAVHDDPSAGMGGANGQLLVDSINAAW